MSQSLQNRVACLVEYASARALAPQIAILVDLSRSSMRRRLWVVDLASCEVLLSALAASGRGRTLATRMFPRTGDVPDSWLTPEGHCLVAERYEGEFGVAYRLDGLDVTNANVRRRAIVLHASPDVPERGCSWRPLWCSRGCIVVSPEVFKKMDALLQKRPSMLWIYS